MSKLCKTCGFRVSSDEPNEPEEVEQIVNKLVADLRFYRKHYPNAKSVVSKRNYNDILSVCIAQAKAALAAREERIRLEAMIEVLLEERAFYMYDEKPKEYQEGFRDALDQLDRAIDIKVAHLEARLKQGKKAKDH